MASGSRLEERKRILAESLPFDALENPLWRKKEEVSVKEMITKILQYHKEWNEKKKHDYDKELVENVYKDFLGNFIFHVNREEGSGFSTFEETDTFLRSCYVSGYFKRSFSSKAEQETVNLKDAYEHLLGKIKREEESSDYGLMEASLLQETHRILMKDILLPKGKTRPGEFSNKRRYTQFKGEEYNYPEPPDMNKAVVHLLDWCNNLFDRCIKDGLKDFDDFYCLFKTCALMHFELLDLHPFSDGNRRLGLILCSYLLSTFTPFPTPVYNVWTDSCKDDYKQALVDARKDKQRHPKALTTMIIECNYHGWKRFFKTLDEKKKLMESINAEKKMTDITLGSPAGSPFGGFEKTGIVQ